jgi:hypothetical protein
MRINLSPERASKFRPWLTELARGFAEAYDIKLASKVKAYLSTPPGSRAFAAWLKSEGFKAEYWCLEPYVYIENHAPYRKITEYLAFGIMISDECPRLVEIKLRHA